MSATDGPVVARAVSLGGGHGQARTLQALIRVAGHVTAIATVADDGGSSGRLRRELGVLPPGDLRMAVAALCDDVGLRDLLDYRFGGDELRGHSLGNLMMVALADLEGGFVEGLDAMLARLGIPHRVLPSTLADVELAGELDGVPIVGQAAIAATVGVTGLHLVGGEPTACTPAVEAIAAADLIVLGPGSVCTSIVPNLLVPAIAEALVSARARRVLVANLDEQAGEGEGRSIADHVAMLDEVVPGLIIDTVLVHDGPAPATNRPALGPDDRLAMMVGGVRTGDFLASRGGHDPAALAAALRALVT